MKLRYRLFQRNNGIFFVGDRTTRKQESLKTRDKATAKRIFNARKAHEQPAINLQIARAYLMASDPLIVQRTWQHDMDEVVKTKQGTTRERWDFAIRDQAFDAIRSVCLIQTQAEHLLRVLQRGSVSTNVHLRKLHNFSLDMNWLPWPFIPKRQRPVIRYRQERAITLGEHQLILNREKNAEMKAFYGLLWHLGGSQTDMVTLKAEDIDWEQMTLTYSRRKTLVPVIISLGSAAAEILSALPKSGALFPRLAKSHEKHRAKLFRKRCDSVGSHRGLFA